VQLAADGGALPFIVVDDSHRAPADGAGGDGSAEESAEDSGDDSDPGSDSDSDGKSDAKDDALFAGASVSAQLFGLMMVDFQVCLFVRCWLSNSIFRCVFRRGSMFLSLGWTSCLRSWRACCRLTTSVQPFSKPSDTHRNPAFKQVCTLLPPLLSLSLSLMFAF
jgi:hypothetical protein